MFNTYYIILLVTNNTQIQLSLGLRQSSQDTVTAIASSVSNFRVNVICTRKFMAEFFITVIQTVNDS